jgi:hypothetical protein
MEHLICKFLYATITLSLIGPNITGIWKETDLNINAKLNVML